MKTWMAVSGLICSVSFTAIQANAESNFLQLECEAAQEVKSQPCGGTNSRQLSLELSSMDTRGNAYRESRAYGGCFPISDEGFGTIEQIRFNGNTVTFDLVRKGSIERKIPILNPEEKEVVHATFDRATMELSLDTSTVFSPYQRPSILGCKYSSL